MKSKISAIATAVPEHQISQQQALDFMVKTNGMNEAEAHDLEVLYRASGIQNRYTVLEDYTKKSDFEFYPNNASEEFPSTQKRMNKYDEEALKLSLQSARKCLEKSEVNSTDITHLITVTCTGLHAPGLDLNLLEELRLKPNTQRTSINFMGCYAAFNAIKLADAFCKASPSKVLIVCTELCTIHFQTGKKEDDLLANALFADGSAALLVETNTEQKSFLEISEYECDVLANGKSEMAWGIGNFGFEMKLSSYVPDVIEGGISKLLHSFNQRFDYYAIHPGGKKILKVIEKSLSIEKRDNYYAHEILKNYGNMSSPTVLFVLNEIFKTLTLQDDNKEMLALAFGPGITLESMIFNIRIN